MMIIDVQFIIFLKCLFNTITMIIKKITTFVLVMISIAYCKNSYFEQKSDDIKILFIGSSYFYSNNLPELFSSLAIAGDKDVFLDRRIVSGTYLEFHANNKTTEDKINQENWDYIVLQGVGRLMAYPDIFTDHPVYPALQTLKQKIFSNYESTKIVFCLPWAYEDGMAWAEGWTDLYFDMQNKINYNTIKYADEIGFDIAPVGVAWQHVLKDKGYPLHYLHQSDWNHPSLNGSYLMACVIYSTIFTESVSDISYLAGLPMNEAKYFQTVASTIVLSNLDQWFNLKNEDSNDLITTYELKQNYPNPFNPTTLIKYSIPEDSYVNLIIYNLLGQEVKTLIDRHTISGHQSILWDATNNYGQVVSAGIYFCSLKTGNCNLTQKMILLN